MLALGDATSFGAVSLKDVQHIAVSNIPGGGALTRRFSAAILLIAGSSLLRRVASRGLLALAARLGD